MILTFDICYNYIQCKNIIFIIDVKFYFFTSVITIIDVQKFRKIIILRVLISM